MPPRPRQLPLLPPPRIEHGGDVRKGLRKEARPFSPKACLHVVLRSHRARGSWSLLHRRNRARIERLAYTWARAKRVRLYRFANVGNHLHLLIRADRPEDLKAFLKTFAGLAARAVSGAKKGVQRGKFWESTAYSKIIPGGAYRAVCAYLGKNRLEAVGFQGARLRIRADGTAVVVVGDAHAAGIEPAQAEAWIRGRPK